MSPSRVGPFFIQPSLHSAEEERSFVSRLPQSPSGASIVTNDSQSPFLARREPPPQTFERCDKPSLVSGWLEALAMFRDWALGSGAGTRRFETCSIQSQNMSDAAGVTAARGLFYQKNEGRPFEQWAPVTNYRGTFGLVGLVGAGPDPTEQFVGSYRVDIFPDAGRNARFEVTNTTSTESFLYGLGPTYEREDLSYGGNMRQTYTWIEPIDVP